MCSGEFTGISRGIENNLSKVSDVKRRLLIQDRNPRSARAGSFATSGRAAECLTVARAEALFASDLSARTTPTRQQATHAIWWAVRRYGGVRGCAAEVAAAYGEYPETAAPRMRWARTVVDAVYGRAGRDIEGQAMVARN